MRQSALETIHALSLSAKDTAFLCLNADYIGGKMMLVRAIEANMEIVVAEPSSHPLPPGHNQITFMALVPLQAFSLLQTSEGTHFLSNCAKIIIGGASISWQLENMLKHLENDIYHTFGMTETVSHIALRKLSGPGKEEVYTKFPSVTIGVDPRSCLKVKGPMTRYQEIISNDVVELTGEHQFRWMGRIDRVINSGGFKVYPDALQRRISEIIWNLGLECQLMVTHQDDDKLGEMVVLILEREDLEEHIRIALRDAFKSELHPYEIPKAIYSQAYFPKTKSGKIDINTLRRQLQLG